MAPPVMGQSAGGNDTLIIGGTEATGAGESYVEWNQSGSRLADHTVIDSGAGISAGALPSHDADHVFVGERLSSGVDGPSIFRWNRSTESVDWTSTTFGGEYTRVLIVDDQGFVWAGFESGNMVKLDPGDGSVVSTNDFHDSGSSTPRDAALLSDGNLLIAYQDDDVVIVNPETESVVERFTPQSTIRALDVDEDGNFYVGGGGEVTKFDDNGFIHGNISVTSGPSPRAMVVTEGNVFVGMGSSGVARYDFGTGNEVWNNSANAIELQLTKDSDVITFSGTADLTSYNSTDGTQNWQTSVSSTSGRFIITNATEFSNVPLASDPDTKLVLNAGEFMQHGSDQEYSVTFTTDADGASDVSDEASVSSDNTSIVTVDETAHTLSATGDTSVNDQATITATFTDPDTGIEYEDTVDVTVAQPTMKNFKILPSSWRLNALFSFDMGSGDSEQDTLPLIILISIFAGGITARVVSSFAGIGAMLLVIVVGWFGGWVGTGVVLSALFVGLFIGFNLAANIDYAVRR